LKKISEIALEELVRLIIFLISLVVVGIIFSKILIPKIFEKNSEALCKYYILLKNDENFFRRTLGSFASFSCISLEKEFLVNNKDEVLYYLLIHIGKTCEITNGNKEELSICPYTLIFKPNNDFEIKREEIISLMYAKLPFNNEVLLNFCTHQTLTVKEDISFSRFKSKAIKICYSFENNRGYIEIKE